MKYTTIFGILLLLGGLFFLIQKENFDLSIGNKKVSRLSGPTEISMVKPKEISSLEWNRKGVALPTVMLIHTDNSQITGQCQNCEETNGCYPIYSPEFMNILREMKNVDIYAQSPIITEDDRLDIISRPNDILSSIQREMMLNRDLEQDTEYIFTQKNKLCYVQGLPNELRERECINPDARWFPIGVTNNQNTEFTYEMIVQYTIDLLSSVSSSNKGYEVSHKLNMVINYLNTPDNADLKQCVLFILNRLKEGLSIYDHAACVAFSKNFLPIQPDSVYKDISMIYLQTTKLQSDLNGILIPGLYNYYTDCMLPYIRKDVETYTEAYKRSNRGDKHIDYTEQTIKGIRNYIGLIQNAINKNELPTDRKLELLATLGDKVYGFIDRIIVPMGNMLNDLYFILMLFTHKAELSIGIIPHKHHTFIYDFFIKTTPLKTMYTPVLRPIQSQMSNYRCVDLHKANISINRVEDSNGEVPSVYPIGLRNREQEGEEVPSVHPIGLKKTSSNVEEEIRGENKKTYTVTEHKLPLLFYILLILIVGVIAWIAYEVIFKKEQPVYTYRPHFNPYKRRRY